jgi:hypothetical protein
MVLLALPIIMAAFITVIIAMPIIMAVFIIAIIAVLLAVLIAGLTIRMVISGTSFVATAVGGIDKEAPGMKLWCFFLPCALALNTRRGKDSAAVLGYSSDFSTATLAMPSPALERASAPEVAFQAEPLSRPLPCAIFAG